MFFFKIVLTRSRRPRRKKIEDMALRSIAYETSGLIPSQLAWLITPRQVMPDRTKFKVMTRYSIRALPALHRGDLLIMHLAYPNSDPVPWDMAEFQPPLGRRAMLERSENRDLFQVPHMPGLEVTRDVTAEGHRTLVIRITEYQSQPMQVYFGVPGIEVNLRRPVWHLHTRLQTRQGTFFTRDAIEVISRHAPYDWVCSVPKYNDGQPLPIQNIDPAMLTRNKVPHPLTMVEQCPITPESLTTSDQWKVPDTVSISTPGSAAAGMYHYPPAVLVQQTQCDPGFQHSSQPWWNQTWYSDTYNTSNFIPWSNAAVPIHPSVITISQTHTETLQPKMDETKEQQQQLDPIEAAEPTELIEPSLHTPIPSPSTPALEIDEERNDDEDEGDEDETVVEVIEQAEDNDLSTQNSMSMALSYEPPQVKKTPGRIMRQDYFAGAEKSTRTEPSSKLQAVIKTHIRQYAAEILAMTNTVTEDLAISVLAQRTSAITEMTIGHDRIHDHQLKRHGDDSVHRRLGDARYRNPYDLAVLQQQYMQKASTAQLDKRVSTRVRQLLNAPLCYLRSHRRIGKNTQVPLPIPKETFPTDQDLQQAETTPQAAEFKDKINTVLLQM